MTRAEAPDGLEVGYDVPAKIGMDEAEIQTPCLMIDLDAFERNVAKMRDICADMGVRHRVHGKMHKSADIARYQIEEGSACGVCCQKVSEAEAFARHGIKDILITNQVRGPAGSAATRRAKSRWLSARARSPRPTAKATHAWSATSAARSARIPPLASPSPRKASSSSGTSAGSR